MIRVVTRSVYLKESAVRNFSAVKKKRKSRIQKDSMEESEKVSAFCSDLTPENLSDLTPERPIATNTITELPLDLWAQQYEPKMQIPHDSTEAAPGEPSHMTHHYPRAAMFNRGFTHTVRPKYRFQRPYPETACLARYEKKHKKTPWYHHPAESEDWEEHPLATKLKKESDPAIREKLVQEGLNEALATTQNFTRKVWKRHEWHRFFYHLGFNDYLITRLYNKMPFTHLPLTRENTDFAMRYLHKNYLHEFFRDGGHHKHVRRIFRGYPHAPMYWHRFDHEKIQH